LLDVVEGSGLPDEISKTWKSQESISERVKQIWKANESALFATLAPGNLNKTDRY